MDGVIPKFGIGAIRINSDIVTFPKKGNNIVREKVPAAPGNRWCGLVLLFSVDNGEPLAIMPDGVMQRMRVGATNGLGIKYLARKDAQTVGILGSGWQAGSQLMAACAVRDIKTIRCFSPNREHREAFATQMTETLGVEVRPVEQPEEAMAGADIAMCASSSLDAIFFEPWVETGMHMTSIKRPEIEMNALRRADRIVIHNNDEKPMHVMTRDLANAEKAKDNGWNSVGDLDFAKLPTLPELIVGRAPGPAIRERDHLLPQQYRAWLPVRGRRRGRDPQGEGKRARPRTADRLVHRRRASLAEQAGFRSSRLLRRLAAAALEMLERLLGALAILLVHLLEIFLREVFRGRESVLGALHRDDQLRKLELQRERVPVLGVLDQEHHQERDDGGRGVDHELPGVAESEQWSGRRPDHAPPATAIRKVSGLPA